MEKKNQNLSPEEREKSHGGLLANVSLLTTGGSSLQQLTNNGSQVATNRNKSTSGKVADEKLLSVKTGQMKNSQLYNTSTPARSEFTNVVYGFDLSPVHSYEMPVARASFTKSLHGSKSQDDLALQNKLEEQLFSDTPSAPNFMQAPSVSSSHQSRLSVRKSDDTETMMSQVYSHQGFPTPTKSLDISAKKRSKGSKPSSRSPSHMSPRKGSKLYSHVQGSGYGMVSPWKSPIKAKTEQKKKAPASTSKKKSKLKQDPSEFLRDSALALLANVKEQKMSHKNYSKFEKTAGNTFKVRQSSELRRETPKTEAENDRRQLATFNLKESAEFKSLKERCLELEEECTRLRSGHDEAHKENFLLTAKLNKLVTVNESGDAMIKDSLNEDTEVGRLKNEIVDQDRLLRGYQQENEKLYSEVARLKVLQRENENAMFNENLKLKSKIASLKEDLQTKEAVIKDKNKHLLDQEKPLPMIDISVQTLEYSELDATKQDLAKDKQILALKSELEQMRDRQMSAADKDTRLMKANEDLSELQREVGRLKRELSIKLTNSKKKESERVEDLQRQVKQLENSLIKAQSKDHMKGILYGDKEKLLLEERCQQLESRLKSQEEQFSNNMSSLHQLYKNMSKDYEERVEVLSDQLQQIKKSQSLHPPVEGRSVEQYNLLLDENTMLKAQIENLKTDLLNERKAKVDKTSPNKPKKKSQAKNESTYHPDYFVQRSPVKPVPPPPPAVSTNQVQDLLIEKENLVGEVARWKSMCGELKASHDKLKQSDATEIDQLTLTHNKVLVGLQNEIRVLKDKLNIVEMDLSTSTSDLLSSSSREKALQLQIRTLVDELQETRRASPIAAFRHLDSLQAEIRMLDFRQKSREDKLDKAFVESADEFMKAEIRSLQNTISQKNLLISKFQCELDSILNVLESLQKSKQVI